MGLPSIVRRLSITLVTILSITGSIHNAFAQWTYRASPQPLIRNISVFPNNPASGTNTVIVSTLTDGMYKAVDTGTGVTWQPISAGIPIVQVRGHAVIAPSLSTGPITDIYAATEGAGVYKTTDGGVSWTAINGTGTTLGCLNVRQIAVPVTTPTRTLIAATACRNNSGVYRSTDDGANWTRLGPATLPGDVQTSSFSRPNGNLFLLSTANYGIFKSLDDGATWATANSGFSILSGINVFGTAFSGAAGVTTDLLTYVHGSGIYRSVDTGASWVAANTGLPTGFAALAGINREAGSTLYVGLDKQGVFKTTDGGLNWSLWGATATDGSAKYTRTIVVDGSGPGRYYLGGLNGIKKTTDNAATFNDGNMPSGGRINSITHDRDAPYVAFIAAQFPLKINYIYGDYNTDALFTPLDNGVTGATTEGAVYQDQLVPATLYVSTNNRGVFKSTNSGAVFAAINIGLPNMIGQTNRLAIDPNNSQNLYLGLADAGGVYKSVNGGASWTLSSAGLSSPLAMSIHHITVDGNNSPIVWIATGAGVYKSADSGATWMLVYSALDAAGSPLPTGSVRVRLGFPNEVYIANNHANADGTLSASSGILRSTNGGVSWSNILPNKRGAQVRVTAGGNIYAGVSALANNPAVYLSTDAGASFTPYSTNLRGSDTRAFGFAADESALITLSLENGFYTNDAVAPPPTVPLLQTITEAPNTFLNLVFAPQIIGTTSASKSVTITNIGTTTANIIGFNIDNNTVFAVQSHTCGGGLPAGASCTVNVTNTPSVGGDGNGSGGLLTAIGPVSGISVKLLSYGASPTLPTARLRLSPGAVPAYPDWFNMGNNFRELSFGNQTIGISRTLSYTLTNFGGGTLTVNPITVDNVRYAVGGTCGATLAAGASCLVSVTYTPTTVGQDFGNVSITTNTAFAVAGQLNFALVGIGETGGAAGSLVTNFGDDGRVFISTGLYGQEFVSSLAQQADGKTLALLSARKIVEDGFTVAAVVRLNADGSLDNTFGSNGIVRLAPPGSFGFDIASTVLALPSGNILVTMQVGNVAGTASDTYVYRLLASGQIDTTFGTAGSTVVPNLVHRFRLAPDGKIVLGGLDSTNPANTALIFTRLTIDGAVDTSFGTNGRTDVFLLDPVQFGQGTMHLEVAADSKILFSYPYNVGTARDFAIYRLTASGVQDTTWGTAGRVNVAPTNREDNLRVTRQQSDGKILLLSRTARAAFPANYEILLARLNTDGTLDNSFGSGGVVETLVAPVSANGSDLASGMRVLADGKIIVAGRRTCGGACSTGSDLMVLRYLPNGTLDPSFGNNGIKIVVLTGSYDAAYAVNIEADGTIVIGGEVEYFDMDRNDSNVIVGTAHIVKLRSFSGGIALNAVQSRKTHGVNGTYDLNVGIGGPVGVESRSIGAGHTIVFQFSGPVTSVGGVSSNPVGTATFAIPASPGNEVVVTLTGVPDNSRPTITLSNINGSGANVAAAIGFLIGDVNNTLSVNASDISGVKARLNQNANPGNFKFDVNTSGVINATDLSAVKARSGLVLPP